MGTRETFRLELTKIASRLETEKLEKLKYLCLDSIPCGDLEKLTTPEQLFLELEQRREIAPNQLQFLIGRLENVGRKDLAEDLKNYERQWEEGCADFAKESSTLLQDSIEKAESYNRRGKVEFKEQRYENACQQYTAALGYLPKDQEKDIRVKYLCNRAACHVKLRKFKEAHEDCDNALLLNPHNEKARYRLVQSLQGEGEIAKAFTEVSSLLKKKPLDSGIAQLECSLKKEVEDAKEKAMRKIRLGHASFQKSHYDLAIENFSEGILLLPKLDMYAKEMKQFYWMRAECYLKKKELESARKDCKEADRLVPGDVLVLYTKMQVLDGLNKYKECYTVCNELIEKKFKVTEANEIIKRLLPKILNEEKEAEKQEEAPLPHSTSSKKSKKKKKGSKKKKEKDEGASEEKETLPTGNDVLSEVYSNNTQSLLGGISEKTSSELVQDHLGSAGKTENEDSESTTKTEIAGNNTQSLLGGGNVKTEDGVSDKTSSEAQLVHDHLVVSRKTEDSELTTKREIAGSLTKDVFFKTGERDALQAMGTVPFAEDKVVIDKAEVSASPDISNTFKDSLTGDACPRRILLICDRWSCWHHSVCTVNKQLCRSFAKGADVHVACLVLEATEQDTRAAARDGVKLIKASLQPGIRQGDKQLLNLHSDFPFTVDLVVGHGMVSGTAAAIQAGPKRLHCRRLHIFHNLPGKEEDFLGDLLSLHREETERGLGLSADFVAGIGPLVVEQWGAILNREIFTIIPGLPEVAPRNQIMTPQSRCLVLGNMINPTMSGLHIVTAALADCRRGQPIHLTVVGAERQKVQDLKEEIKTGLRFSRVQVAVKPFDMSHEAVGVEVRGVSLVLIPSLSDGFGMVALEAIAAKVPFLVTSSSGIAKFLRKEFGNNYLKSLCSTEEDTDSADAWTNAIDNILDDREEAFNMAASLWDKWNSTFTWDLTVDKLLKHLGSSGVFHFLSPSANKRVILPSQCSAPALTFMEAEVDLLNRRRQHVLFLSPENSKESPFIHCFSQVPWAAVIDFDVNSVKTGFLASCENFCTDMGMKICRILPPSDQDHKKMPVPVLTGIPWVLLEGMPENERNIKQNLEWISTFFLALGKTHPQVPITFLVLWKSSKGNKVLLKKLSKVLTAVQFLPLYNQVKLAIASTGDAACSDLEEILEEIAEEWEVQVRKIRLEDVCNALCQCVNSSPFIQENRDFSLPVADPGDSRKVTFKVLPPSSRWINAEMEILFHSVGSRPQFEKDDACHFYRGGLISWYALQMGYAVERANWKTLKARVDDLLLKAGSVTLQMPHQRGAGGSTSARKILFDYHEQYPCVLLTSVGHAEVAAGIKVLAEFCKLPVIILVDRKKGQSDESDVSTLFNILSNDRIPCLILEVIHQNKEKESKTILHSSGKSEETPKVRLADDLSSHEADQFVKIYSAQRKEKLGNLRDLRDLGPKQLQIPFYYALTTFEDRFTALEPFVRDCLQNLDQTERKILLFLALAHHYGDCSLSANEFAELLQVPRREVILLESFLPEASIELLLEEDDKWRPRHDLIGVEMLRQLLTMDQKGVPSMHPDNWKSCLAEKAVEFFGHMSETVVRDMLVLPRVPSDSHFTRLVSDMPSEEDAIKLFERAISLFPDEPFFKVHLGRFYCIRKKSAGFSMAIKYTDEGILCSQSYPHRTRGQFAQMKGMVYSREVMYLIQQEAELKYIIERAEEGVKNFRRAVSIAPDFVNGYIPEVRMMCKVFEYIDSKTGNFFEYVKSSDANPFIIDAISDTSNTLECVPDSDEYPHWRMRLACLGRRNSTPENIQKTLDLLYDLQTSGSASRASINRQIVIMTMDMCVKSGESLSTIAPDMVKLLEEALKHDTNMEQTMRLWVRLATFIPVSLSEAEGKVFKWCSKEKSVRSYLYKFIVACLHVLEGKSSYIEVMRNVKDDLYSEIKSINRENVGRCRHPDRPVVWLGQKRQGMGHLVYLDRKRSKSEDVRTQRYIDTKDTKQLGPLTGIIVETGPKAGKIRVKSGLDVSFRADLCETQLTSSVFMNRKVHFFLAFTFFGTDAYNVKLVAE